MAAADTRLSLLTFPQRIGPAPAAAGKARLDVRLFVAPTRSLLDPLAPNLPALADAWPRLALRATNDLADLPSPGGGTILETIELVPPADVRSVISALTGRIAIAPNASPASEGPQRMRVFKLAPPSFLEAAGSALRGSRHLVSAETYACAMRDTLDPALRPPPRPMPTALSWNQVLARAMRQPLLARALGLVHALAIDIPEDAFAEGAFLWVEPEAGTNLAVAAAAAPDLVRTYAARLPRLDAESSRPLFAPVLFPVREGGPPPGMNYDDAFGEAAAYDDGFAKIVHAHQPRRHDEFDIAQAGSERSLPIQDGGIRLGWDDEQIVEWLNRQVAEDPRNLPAGQSAREAPLGVLGYRVDVRDVTDGNKAWTSLVEAEGSITLDGLDLGAFSGELAVEAVPGLQQRVSTGGQTLDQFWLPPFLARWPGGSLIAGDAVSQAFAGKDPARRWFTPVNHERVPLRYGREYEFRVRLMDITGGGPGPSSNPVNGAHHAGARLRYRRFAPPKDLRWNDLQDIEGERRRTIHLFRPLIGHPDALYVAHGFDPRPALIEDLEAAKLAGREPGLEDPDVTHVRIDIKVGALEGDSANEGSTSGPVQPLPGSPLLRPFTGALDDALAVDLRFIDVSSPEALPANGPAGPIHLPSARDIVIEITPVARPDPAMVRAGMPDPVLIGDPHRRELARSDPGFEYFGSHAARVGLTSRLRLREPSVDESGLLIEGGQPPLQAIILAPDPPPTDRDGGSGDLLGRLAFHLGLRHDGLAFSPTPGSRKVMACSSRFAHLATPDRGTIIFGNQADLVDRWLVVLQLRLSRDWSWDGLAPEGFEVWRKIDGGPDELAGRIPVPRALAMAARETGPDTDRSFTDLLFVDSIDTLPRNGLPAPVHLTYRLSPRLRDPVPVILPEDWTGSIELPVASPPTDRPEVLSAGLVASPYVNDPAYASTEPRRQMLWLEFASEPLNPIDRPWARTLAWSPDPVLTGEPPRSGEAVDPALAIPDERIRIILPDQSDDRTGLDAMQPLIPTEHPRRFLLPLPAGMTSASAELFGFFRYEFRMGHGPEVWSTARARFGPSARMNGIQHPVPTLECKAVRLPDRLLVTAPFARAASPDYPAETRRTMNTEIWFLLYTQASRCDGQAMRNVLLARRQGHLVEGSPNPLAVQRAHALWSLSEIAERTAILALGTKPPLSVLAVEMMPTGDPNVVDPLAADLGEARILRASPLVPVPHRCVESA